MLTEKGSSVFIGSPVMLIPRSVSHHRPGVRDDQPFQYDTNDWFSIENESLLLCSLAVISLRITWDLRLQERQEEISTTYVILSRIAAFLPGAIIERAASMQGTTREYWSIWKQFVLQGVMRRTCFLHHLCNHGGVVLHSVSIPTAA